MQTIATRERQLPQKFVRPLVAPNHGCQPHGATRKGAWGSTMSVSRSSRTADCSDRPSGAGKSTLLAALAGIAPAPDGTLPSRVTAPKATTAASLRSPRRRPARELRYAHTSLRSHPPDSGTGGRHRLCRRRRDGHARTRDTWRDSRAPVEWRRAQAGEIASEILTRPGIIFLDEPTSGLDPSAAADLIDGLHRMPQPEARLCSRHTASRTFSEATTWRSCAGADGSLPWHATEVLRVSGLPARRHVHQLARADAAPRPSRHHRDTSSSDGIHAARRLRRPARHSPSVDAHKTSPRSSPATA